MFIVKVRSGSARLEAWPLGLVRRRILFVSVTMALILMWQWHLGQSSGSTRIPFS